MEKTLETCPECNAKVSDDARFCQSCGRPLDGFETESFTVNADDLVRTVKQLLHEGNITRIVVKDEQGRQLLDIPVTIGVIGAVIAPWLAALGAIAAIATRCTIEITKKTSD